MDFHWLLTNYVVLYTFTYFRAFHQTLFSGLHSSICQYKITSIAGNKILCPLLIAVLYCMHKLVGSLGLRLVSVWNKAGCQSGNEAGYQSFE